MGRFPCCPRIVTDLFLPAYSRWKSCLARLPAMEEIRSFARLPCDRVVSNNPTHHLPVLQVRHLTWDHWAESTDVFLPEAGTELTSSLPVLFGGSLLPSASGPFLHAQPTLLQPLLPQPVTVLLRRCLSLTRSLVVLLGPNKPE